MCMPIHTRWCYGGCRTRAWQKLPQCNKLSSSNLWLQYRDKSRNSDIPHFSDYILHSCQARLGWVSVSVHVIFIWCPFSVQLWNTLHMFTDDRALVCSCTHKFTEETETCSCPLAILNSVNMKLWFQGSPRTPSDTGSSSDLEYVSTSIQVLLTDQVWTARIIWWTNSPRTQIHCL